jgi:DNA replication protein DnaC
LESNPFSTRFIQPGAIPFYFAEVDFAKELVSRFLQRQPCKMSIVGPHGSGKSSLVAAMIPLLSQELDRFDRPIVHFRVTHGIRQSRPTVRELTALASDTVLIIDGYEQLSAIEHFAVLLKCMRTSVSLLATSHHPIGGIKTLWETRMDELIERVVLHHLLESYPPSVFDEAIHSEVWKESRLKHHDNLRESLFDMYDWWETRK